MFHNSWVFGSQSDVSRSLTLEMVKIILTIVLLIAILGNSKCLLVYHRSADAEDPSRKVGLKFDNSQNIQNINWKNGISICIRYKFKHLGQIGNPLFFIGKSDTIALTFLMQWVIGNDLPSFGGILMYEKSKKVLYYPWIGFDMNEAHVGFVRYWHHLCLVFNLQNSTISFAVVSVNLDV